MAQATDTLASLQKQIDTLIERIAGQTRMGTNMELAGLAPFSPDIRSTTMLVGMKFPSFTKFTGKMDPEEHIVEFQSQMSFQHPCIKVYYRAFPSSLAGPALKWFDQLSEGCITSFEELKRWFTRTYVVMEIEGKRMLPGPPRQKTPQNKRDSTASIIRIMEMSKTSNRSRSSNGPPSNTGRVNVISGGGSGRGDFRSARRAYAKRNIFAVTAGARPEFPDMSFSRRDFEGIECPHEDPLVITQVIVNFEGGLPYGVYEKASAAGHKNGRVHHRGHTGEIQGSEKKGSRVLFGLHKAHQGLDGGRCLVEEVGEPRERNVCTLQVSEESPEKGHPHEES
ncbi:hypothetical protein LIER_31188 [Lithospermum erythrorhizon]|uniref:Retrotransposon gag domain-containing protein n=1 Tax=Lithospermum erythrorhizon TaxID=34254 RepID=A0AAV3RU55_LITER